MKKALMVLGTIIFLFSISNSFENQFESAIDYALPSGPHHSGYINSGDFDNDGDIDILSNGLWLLSNIENENLDLLTEKLFDVVGGKSLALDVDLDTDIDLITMYNYEDIAVLINNGHCNYDTSATYWNFNRSAASINEIRLNTDSLPDIAILMGDNISLLINTGNGYFEEPVRLNLDSLNIQTDCFAIMDINSDDLDEMILMGNNDSLIVLLNQGNAEFIAGPYSQIGYNPLGFNTSNMDDDDQRELVIGDITQDKLFFYESNGTDQLILYDSLMFTCSPYKTLFEDLNGDNRVDLILYDYNTGKMIVYTGALNGQFASTNSINIGEVYSVAINDFNADGFKDIVIGLGGETIKASIYLNDGNNDFISIPDIYYGVFTQFGYINDDEYIDKIVNNTDSGSTYIYINSGNGTFTLVYEFESYQVKEVAFSDLDNDLDTDIVILSSGSQITVLRNTGNGDDFLNWQIHTYLEIGISGYDMEIIDVDLDGYNDIFLVSSWKIFALVNNGSGGFKLGDTLSVTPITDTDDAILDYALMDYNNDNYVDYIAIHDSYQSPYQLKIYINNQDSTFTKADSIYSENLIHSIHVYDYNGDNFKDLLWASRGKLEFFQNNQDSTFSLANEVAIRCEWDYLYDIDIIDFDNDTDDDIAIFGSSKATVYLVQNIGGSFESYINYSAVDKYCVNQNVCDYDNDGDMDIIIEGYNSTLLLNNWDQLTDIGDSNDNLIIPQNYSLNQNYPNPFNPTTTIEYSLPSRSDVSIGIYNLLGQKVTTFDEGSRPAGKNSVQWNGTDYDGNRVASGIYFYQLKTDNFVESRKMILLK